MSETETTRMWRERCEAAVARVEQLETVLREITDVAYLHLGLPGYPVEAWPQAWPPRTLTRGTSPRADELGGVSDARDASTDWRSVTTVYRVLSGPAYLTPTCEGNSLPVCEDYARRHGGLVQRMTGEWEFVPGVPGYVGRARS